MKPLTVFELLARLQELARTGRGHYRVDVLSLDDADFGAVTVVDCSDRESHGVPYIDLITNLEAEEVCEK